MNSYLTALLIALLLQASAPDRLIIVEVGAPGNAVEIEGNDPDGLADALVRRLDAVGQTEAVIVVAQPSGRRAIPFDIPANHSRRSILPAAEAIIAASPTAVGPTSNVVEAVKARRRAEASGDLIVDVIRPWASATSPNPEETGEAERPLPDNPLPAVEVKPVFAPSPLEVLFNALPFLFVGLFLLRAFRRRRPQSPPRAPRPPRRPSDASRTPPAPMPRPPSTSGTGSTRPGAASRVLRDLGLMIALLLAPAVAMAQSTESCAVLPDASRSFETAGYTHWLFDRLLTAGISCELIVWGDSAVHVGTIGSPADLILLDSLPRFDNTRLADAFYAAQDWALAQRDAGRAPIVHIITDGIDDPGDASAGARYLPDADAPGNAQGRSDTSAVSAARPSSSPPYGIALGALLGLLAGTLLGRQKRRRQELVVEDDDHSFSLRPGDGPVDLDDAGLEVSLSLEGHLIVHREPPPGEEAPDTDGAPATRRPSLDDTIRQIIG